MGSQSSSFAVSPQRCKISPHVPSTCVQNSSFSLLILHIISSSQIEVAINNTSLIPSITCLNRNRYRRSYLCAAHIISHAEHF